MIDLRKYAMFPESNNFLDSSTPGLEELERFNKIMEETQKNLNIKSGSRNDIIYEKEADKNKWITSKGEELSLEEMNSSHILNAIRKIKSSTGWREDWLPILEAELTRRSMIARTDDYEKKIITDEEKMYFLCTSCEYQMLSVEGGSLSDILNITINNDQVKSYIKDNIFCIPLEQSKENFISEMDKLVRETRSNSKEDAEKFMSYYEKYLLINVFSKEWSNFMNLMLGRHGK